MNAPISKAFTGYARQSMQRLSIGMAAQADKTLSLEMAQQKEEAFSTLERIRSEEEARLREIEESAAAAEEAKSSKAVEATEENETVSEEEKNRLEMGRAEIADVVLSRLHVAWVAMTLGLPDHAVSLLRHAYSDVRGNLRSFLGELRGRKPNKEEQKTIDLLRFLQDKVLTHMRLALTSHGGPDLSMEEVEALLIEDRDVEPEGMDPVATGILQSFNLNKTKGSLKKNAFSGVEKIVKKLPELLLSVAESLQTLREDPDAGAGSAQMFVNAALSKLELAKGLLRILSGTENVFKAMVVQSLKLDRFQEQVEQLSGMADEVYLALEDRGFIRGRAQGLTTLPTIEELEMMSKKPELLQQKLNAKPQQKGDAKPMTPAPLLKRSGETAIDAGPFGSSLSVTGLNTRG